MRAARVAGGVGGVSGNEWLARALSMSGRGQANQMMPVFAKAQRRRQALQLNNPQRDVNVMFDVFLRFGTGSADPNGNLTSNEYRAKRQESAVSLFAAEEMMAKRKLAMAVNYLGLTHSSLPVRG